MRRVQQRKKFLRDLMRQVSRGADEAALFAIVRILAIEGRLPGHYRPPKLHGEYQGLWECHVGPNWLLIYDISESEVTLVRTGSHEDLF